MSPLIFLIIMLAMPALALLIQQLQTRQLRSLQSIARKHELHFASDDRFKIASKVAQLLPSPGAAHVRVYNVIYGKDGARYHFVFSVDWIEGALRGKRRISRVASFSEAMPVNGSEGMSLQLAPEELSTLEQYESLYAHCTERCSP